MAYTWILTLLNSMVECLYAELDEVSHLTLKEICDERDPKITSNFRLIQKK